MLSMGPEQSAESVRRAVERIWSRIEEWFQAGGPGGPGVLGVRLQRAACRCPEAQCRWHAAMALDARPRLGLSFVGEGLPWRGRVVGVRTTLWWAVGYGPEVERPLERAHRDLVGGWR